MFRQLKTYQRVVDIVLASLFFLILLGYALHSTAINPVALFCMPLALGFRRASPGLSLAIAWVGALGQVFGSRAPDFSDVAILAVLYTTARYGERAVRWLGLASAGLGAIVATALLVVVPVWSDSIGLSGNVTFGVPEFIAGTGLSLIGSFAVLGLAWTLGLLVRTYSRARESRAAQVAAERDIVVEQERNRIARDMHDVVAHSLAVVIAQADGARYARKLDPDAVDTALTTISSTAREALGDVRILLGQLRHSQGESPQPMLADLERLIEQLRASGLTVVVDELGTEISLPAGQQLAVYRIVQEALTNALRHGDTTEKVLVTFDWSPETLTVSIVNGTAPEAQASDNPAGHGLAGMRERAVLWGGTFAAARGSTGHYLVTATLPIRPIPAPES